MTVYSLAAAEADQKTREKKHEERERFSVAAIAFCLEHDNSFKTHFLQVIAGLSANEIDKITLEPKYWGDLVLEGSRHVLVLEFKLGALLQDHQSPEARIFSKTGYGAEILRHFTKAGKTLRYIVIGKEFAACRPNGLQCSAVPWRKLVVSDGRKESKIERDLYNCLGYLGASVFLNRHMKESKLANKAGHAMTVCGTLKQLLAENGLPCLRSLIEPGFCGVEVRSAGKERGPLYTKLKSLVRPKAKQLVWIGYESIEDATYLSVWFYCTAKTAPVVRRCLEASKSLGLLEKDDDSDAIYIRLPGKQSNGDAEWFLKVLQTAVANPLRRASIVKDDKQRALGVSQ